VDANRISQLCHSENQSLPHEEDPAVDATPARGIGMPHWLANVLSYLYTPHFPLKHFHLK